MMKQGIKFRCSISSLLQFYLLSAVAAAVVPGVMGDDGTRKLIRNGSPAPPDKYPSFVGLNVRGTGLICGGTLVAEDIMLTAAHCINLPSVKLPLLLLYVSTTTTVQGEGAGGEHHQVVEVLTHPKFDPTDRDTGGNDVMLVKFRNPITDPNRIVTLNTQNVTVNTVAWFTGDGLTAPDWNARPNQLMEATDLVVIECPDKEYPFFHKAHDICTMAGPSHADPCTFDSGSPLFNATTGHQIGILSTGVADEAGAMICVDTYSGFTSVSRYYDWIQDGIGSLREGNIIQEASMLRFDFKKN